MSGCDVVNAERVEAVRRRIEAEAAAVNAAAVREMQGEHAADPVPGDVDLFTGALFVAPVTAAGRRVLVPGGGVQDSMF